MPLANLVWVAVNKQFKQGMGSEWGRFLALAHSALLGKLTVENAETLKS
jgi:hypothetical protein